MILAQLGLDKYIRNNVPPVMTTPPQVACYDEARGMCESSYYTLNERKCAPYLIDCEATKRRQDLAVHAVHTGIGIIAVFGGVALFGIATRYGANMGLGAAVPLGLACAILAGLGVMEIAEESAWWKERLF